MSDVIHSANSLLVSNDVILWITSVSLVLGRLYPCRSLMSLWTFSVFVCPPISVISNCSLTFSPKTLVYLFNLGSSMSEVFLKKFMKESFHFKSPPLHLPRHSLAPVRRWCVVPVERTSFPCIPQLQLTVRSYFSRLFLKLRMAENIYRADWSISYGCKLNFCWKASKNIQYRTLHRREIERVIEMSIVRKQFPLCCYERYQSTIVPGIQISNPIIMVF